MHEITIRDSGKAEMAYVGETPWHGLGTKLPVGVSVAEMTVAAGLDWKVDRAVVEFQTGILDDVTRRSVPDRHVLFRADTHKPLAVVSDRYKVVQPSEVMEFFHDLVEVGGFQMETAGSLYGGKRIWALAKLGESAAVKDVDEVGGYLLLATSTDGSLATTARFTTVRTVCSNTLTVAMRSGKRIIATPHSTNFDPAKVKQQLGVLSGAFERFMLDANMLADAKMSPARAESFLRTLLDGHSTRDVAETDGFKKIMALFNGEGRGASLTTAQHTAWGMLNAVTEYYDYHAPSRTTDARLNSAWFGKSSAIKEHAFESLLVSI